MAELVDASDLKSEGPRPSGFESRHPYHLEGVSSTVEVYGPLRGGHDAGRTRFGRSGFALWAKWGSRSLRIGAK